MPTIFVILKRSKNNRHSGCAIGLHGAIHSERSAATAFDNYTRFQNQRYIYSHSETTADIDAGQDINSFSCMGDVEAFLDCGERILKAAVAEDVVTCGRDIVDFRRRKFGDDYR